ncbi:MAG: Gfo/Idh/MocA family oxidoreductase [Bacteroidota bacterium]
MHKMNRRSFGTIMTMGSLSMMSGRTLSTCSSSSATSSTQKKKLGVALVGLGYYSRDLLAPALQLTEHCELTGIVTGSPDKIPVWQEKYGIPDANVYNYENMSGIANNDDIDVIYIVLPTGLHAKYAILAAETGKHVWCEKPMAIDVPECQDIIDACRKNGVKLSIGYRVQHEPNMQEIMRLGQEKTFGSITAGLSHAGYGGNRQPSGWRADKSLGGGALYDMGVYAINGIRHAMNSEPVAVSEASHPRMHTEVDLTTAFMLEFTDGVMAECRTSVVEDINRLELTCQNGSYYLSPMQTYNGLRGMRSDGVEIYTPIPNQQARQMDDDALAIINDTEVMVPGIDGLRDIAIVNAVLKAAQTGGRVVLG